MSSDTPNPDWTAWLARAEAEACGDEDAVDYVMTDRDRPDRGWRRLGDVAAKVVAGLVGGGMTLLALGAGLYAIRAL